MINIALIFVGGISAFAWQRYNNRKRQKTFAINQGINQGLGQNSSVISVSGHCSDEYDDVKEIKHNYKSSLYAFALVSAGSFFYHPIMLTGLPFLGYGLIGFINALKHSPRKEVKSPLVVFEIMSVSATLLAQHFFILSLILTTSLFRREFLLRVGNLVNYYSTHNCNLSPAGVWVIRDGVELEVTTKELREGDVVVGRAGDTILIEGEVIKGEASIRQFSLQRKMKNIIKGAGDKVYPFTVIDSGTLHININ